MSKKVKVTRSAVSGKFITKSYLKGHPAKTVTQTVRKVTKRKKR
ncbi:MAG TPA: hypothetical protein VJJ47_03410 [Candidatus Paceibacterota bacterium]